MQDLSKNEIKLESLIDNLRGVYQSENLVEILEDYERVLDNLDMYAYLNWGKGELIEGPISSRHWVTAKFMWPKKMPPDPLFFNRLENNGIDFKVTTGTFKRPIEIESYEDFQPGTFYPKMAQHPVWCVEICIPKFMIQEVEQGYVSIDGEEIKMDDLDEAYDNDLDKEGVVNQDTEDNYSE